MASKDEDSYPIADEAATIRPPRPEDAGLEDCALPLESIMEAFARAAVLSTGPRAINEEKDEEDEANVDTREEDVTVVVEDGSGRKLTQADNSDTEE